MRGAARSLGRVGAFARVRRTKQHPIQIVPVPVGTSVFFRVGDPSTIANACFATAAAVSDDELAPSRRPVTAGDFYFRSAQADDRLKDDTDYLLHDTVVGRMTLRDRSLAHRIMTAWKRTNSTHGAILVQQVLERIVEEDEAGNGRVADASSRLYHIAIEAWAHSGDEECGRRAEAILSRMEERHRKLTEFESRWGNSNTGTETSHTNIARARPDARCFHLTLHALAKSREEDVTERAEHLVQRMEDMAKVDPESSIQPQTTTYNCLMNVYASRKGTYGIGQIAEDLLLGMAERNKDGDFSINPDTLSFNTVLKAWLNSGECAFESACRAEQLLRLMAKLGADGHNFLPDAISFLTCLNCFEKAVSEEQKDGSLIVDHVDGLIDLAEETGAAGDDLTRFFNTALNVVAKSKMPEKYKKAKSILEKLKETDCKEDIDATSYNIALNACAFVARPEDKEGALETATQIFEECRRQNKADEVTYGTYLKALRKCSSGTDCKRESFVQDLIKQAKDSGHFGYLLRKELKHMYRDRLAEKLGIEAENKIPSSWQRNAKTLHVRKSRQRN